LRRWITAKARKGAKDRKDKDQTGTEVHQIWTSTRRHRFPGACGAGAAGTDSWSFQLADAILAVLP
jgi:hypothetical protein